MYSWLCNILIIFRFYKQRFPKILNPKYHHILYSLTGGERGSLFMLHFFYKILKLLQGRLLLSTEDSTKNKINIWLFNACSLGEIIGHTDGQTLSMKLREISWNTFDYALLWNIPMVHKSHKSPLTRWKRGMWLGAQHSVPASSRLTFGIGLLRTITYMDSHTVLHQVETEVWHSAGSQEQS